jgi:hypothetical protein
MKILRAFAWIVPLGSAALLSACDVEQPLPQCTVGRGEHAVRYYLTSGSGACANKTAEVVGAQIFREPGSGIPPTLIFKPAPLAANEGKDPANSNSVTASGAFMTEYPGEDEICEAPSFTEARQVVAQANGTTVDIRYQWSNVRVQGSAAIPGTQWSADLVYSEGECTATYRAVGMFPALKCERTVAGKVERDPAICKQPRPGLSIDPAFITICDPGTNLCVLGGEPPQLISQP